MDGAQFLTTDPSSGQIIMQAVQSNQVTQPQQQQVIQLGNGQQIIIPAGQVMQGQTIQIQGTQPGQMQQVQVIQPQAQSPSQPQQIVLQNGAGGQTVVGGQVMQTADGQTIVYQAQEQQQTQPQIIQVGGAQGGQVLQVAGGASLQGNNIIQVPTSCGNGQNIIMMMPGGGSATMATPAQRLPVQDQELLDDQPLYVNAKQYHRILKRRQQRAKLEASGKIPKERRKYLHESRHRHAMKRFRGEGGRFFSNEGIKMEGAKGQTLRISNGQSEQKISDILSQFPSTSS